MFIEKIRVFFHRDDVQQKTIQSLIHKVLFEENSPLRMGCRSSDILIDDFGKSARLRFKKADFGKTCLEESIYIKALPDGTIKPYYEGFFEADICDWRCMQRWEMSKIELIRSAKALCC